MREQKIEFYSDGFKLDGSFFFPDGDVAADTPVVIVCSGYTGLKHIHPERYARFLTKRGYVCFGFDYRGFANSEGTRDKVLLEEQERDIANAVSFVRHHETAKGRKLVLGGWGMAGGMIFNAARLVDGVDALMALNGFYNSKRLQKKVRGEQGYKDYLAWREEERARLVNGGEVTPIEPFHIYPLDPISAEYVDNVLRKVPGYVAAGDMRFADSLFAFNAEKNLDEFADTPLFIGHGAQNVMHPVDEAKSLAKVYPGPVELFLLEGGGHTEWMLDDNPLFQQFAGRIADWLDTKPYNKARKAA